MEQILPSKNRNVAKLKTNEAMTKKITRHQAITKKTQHEAMTKKTLKNKTKIKKTLPQHK